MKLKALVLLSSVTLVGCGSLFTPSPYYFSDQEVKKLIVEKNKIAQCLFPNKYKVIDNKFILPKSLREAFDVLVADARLKQLGINESTRDDLVTWRSSNIKKYRMMLTDDVKNDFNKKWNTFYNSEPAEFSESWCIDTKSKFDNLVDKYVDDEFHQKHLIAIKIAKYKEKQKFYNSAEGQKVLAQEKAEIEAYKKLSPIEKEMWRTIKTLGSN